jgi:hypothetical protein
MIIKALAILPIVFFLIGCATTGTDPSKQSFVNYKQNIEKNQTQLARVYVYRDSGVTGMAGDIPIFLNGKKIIDIGNKKFSYFEAPTGSNEIKIILSFLGINNPACSKTFFFSSSQPNYLKIGPREGYSALLNMTIIGLANEYSKENENKCGGPFEPFSVQETKAIEEINNL